MLGPIVPASGLQGQPPSFPLPRKSPSFVNTKTNNSPPQNWEEPVGRFAPAVGNESLFGGKWRGQALGGGCTVPVEGEEERPEVLAPGSPLVCCGDFC